MVPQVFVALVAASGGLLFGYDLGVHFCIVSRPVTPSMDCCDSGAWAYRLHKAAAACMKLSRLYGASTMSLYDTGSDGSFRPSPWPQQSACRAMQA